MTERAPWRRSRGVLACLGLALATSLGGCLPFGAAFPTEPVPRLERGVQSQADVQRMFGEPFRVGLDDGDLTWTYLHGRYSLLGDTTSRDLVIRFDAQGKVSSYSFNTTEPSDLPAR